MESAQNWDTSDGTEHLKQSNNSKGGGMYLLKNEEDDVNARIASLTRKIEAIELGKGKQPAPVCRICECDTHSSEDCPTIPAFREVLHEQANATNTYRRPFTNQMGNMYNPNWRNHPNFNWSNGKNAN